MDGKRPEVVFDTSYVQNTRILQVFYSSSSYDVTYKRFSDKKMANEGSFSPKRCELGR